MDSIYGVTDGGGAFGSGPSCASNRTVPWRCVRASNGETDGGTPGAALTAGPGGKLYGVNAGLFSVDSSGQVHHGPPLPIETGQGLQSPLVVAADRLLSRGSELQPGRRRKRRIWHRGAVQPCRTGGSTMVHAFTGGDSGANPAWLVAGPDEVLHGSTRSGAGGNGDAGNGGGILFRLDAISLTPPGTNVEVQPIDPTTGTAPVNLTFGESSSPGPPPSSRPRPLRSRRRRRSIWAAAPTYFHVETTAVFSGPIQVCFDLAPGAH